jgi:hypothetical protein
MIVAALILSLIIAALILGQRWPDQHCGQKKYWKYDFHDASFRTGSLQAAGRGVCVYRCSWFAYIDVHGDNYLGLLVRCLLLAATIS